MFETVDVAGLLDKFLPDRPRPEAGTTSVDRVEGRIAGCTAVPLPIAADNRGDLIELLTTRGETVEPIVHVYQVFCAPGSVRAWVFHEHQTDRLCYTDGTFRVALCDIRPDSPTAGRIITLFPGAEAPMLLTIPPFVAHGVQNMGETRSSFVNLPTNIYWHERPDKRRLPFNSPLIPYTW
jgi:dTDP-4-dehydrorhamnose 3,5-epimerase